MSFFIKFFIGNGGANVDIVIPICSVRNFINKNPLFNDIKHTVSFCSVKGEWHVGPGPHKQYAFLKEKYILVDMYRMLHGSFYSHSVL